MTPERKRKQKIIFCGLNSFRIHGDSMTPERKRKQKIKLFHVKPIVLNLRFNDSRKEEKTEM